MEGWWYHATDLQACEPLVEGLPRTFVVDAASVELKDLMAAIGVGDVEAVRTLVKHVDVNERFGCWGALHFATSGGYTGKKWILPRQAELVTVLLRSGAAVDAMDSAGDTEHIIGKALLTPGVQGKPMVLARHGPGARTHGTWDLARAPPTMPTIADLTIADHFRSEALVPSLGFQASASELGTLTRA